MVTVNFRFDHNRFIRKGSATNCSIICEGLIIAAFGCLRTSDYRGNENGNKKTNKSTFSVLDDVDGHCIHVPSGEC